MFSTTAYMSTCMHDYCYPHEASQTHAIHVPALMLCGSQQHLDTFDCLSELLPLQPDACAEECHLVRARVRTPSNAITTTKLY
jgi:hypothetical protein